MSVSGELGSGYRKKAEKKNVFLRRFAGLQNLDNEKKNCCNGIFKKLLSYMYYYYYYYCEKC